jgi:hypothetical protein
MISSIDRGDSLRLTHQDFRRALTWLQETEVNMEAIFNVASTVDAHMQDELVAWLVANGPATQPTLIRRAARMLPQYSVEKTINLLALAGRIEKQDDGTFVALG